MAKMDGYWSAMATVPGWADMAPCMKRCDDQLPYNGCDKARCFCTKGNLDLRMSWMSGCASTRCTFANMNTQTDLVIMSTVQVKYCIEKGFGPAGMTLPSEAPATQTVSGTGATGVPVWTRTGSSYGPTATSPSYTPTRSSTGSALGTAAQVGIGLGISVFGIICLAILYRVLRRIFRKPVQYPRAANTGPAPVMNSAPPPPYQPAPLMGTTSPPPQGPFSPPPLQQPVPVHAAMKPYVSTRGDVSPISDSSSPAVGAGVLRKEVGSANRASVTPSSPVAAQAPAMTAPLDSVPTTAEYRQQGPQEVFGSVPPQRFEASTDGQITNTVSLRGMELDGQQVPVHQYPGQHQQLHGPREVMGSVPPQRFEVSNDGQITNSVSPRRMELDGQQVPVNQYPGQQPPQQGAWAYQYPAPQEVEGQNQWHQGHAYRSQGGRHELEPGR